MSYPKTANTAEPERFGQELPRGLVTSSVRVGNLVGKFQSGKIGETSHRSIQFKPKLGAKKARIDRRETPPPQSDSRGWVHGQGIAEFLQAGPDEGFEGNYLLMR